MNPRLVAISGPLRDSVFPITKDPLTVGRAADNQVCLDDELVSKHHFSVWIEDGLIVLKDGDTRNGTWVNGRAEWRKFLQNGDRIKCGSTTFLCLVHEDSPIPLPAIINDETDRNRELETLRADYSVRDEAAVYYRAVNQVFVNMARSLNAIPDIGELQVRLLNLAFDMIPALRGAILLNGRHASPEPSDFISEIYRERDFDGPARFVLSGKVLGEVYAHGEACISNNITPVLCVPLIVSGAIRGALYMEGTQPRSSFEPEHVYYLKGIAEIAIAGLRLARQLESLKDEKDLLKEQIQTDYEWIGISEASQAVLKSMEKVAASDATVLIQGESGTGKELVAHGIHQMSGRREHPFVAVNCGGIVETLLQSELFGHAKGAFTNAVEARRGKIRQADGGTVFLDEIAELTMSMQSALLRFLQDQKFEPLGKDQTIKADVRLIAATNVDLEEAVRQKTFRHDLFFRLNVVVIHVPSLRERREDIPLLAAHFLKKHSTRRRVTDIAAEAMEAMTSFDWPGNVRELENVIQAAIINGSSEVIRLEDLPKRVTERKPPAAMPDDSLKQKAQRAARDALRAELQRRLAENGGDVPEAAQWARISKSYAYRLLSEDP